ncbi:MAG: ribonuclease HI [Desulfobacterales bacterium]|nr:ribonuclease HI [Desulfobacterales bacterium]
MGKQKYYAVRKGKKPGIYRQWFGPDGAQVQVAGFPGAVYKGFGSRQEAELFLRPLPEGRDERASHDEDAVNVFTDGGALGNPGPGGYGVVILEPDGPPRELRGGFKRTTNNRMELMGCLAALEVLTGSEGIVLHSDSRYLVDAVNKGWARNWRRKGWRKSNGQPALNIDLWTRLLDLLDKRNVTFKWVKGHAGNVWNERCDQLVHEAITAGGLAIDEGYAPSSE